MMRAIADANGVEYLGWWPGPNEAHESVPIFQKPSETLVTYVAGRFVRGDLVEGRFLPDSRDPNRMLLATVEDKLCST